MKRKPITLTPDILGRIASLPGRVLVQHCGMSEGEALEFRLTVALAALGAPAATAPKVAQNFVAMLEHEPEPEAAEAATVVDSSPLSAAERLAMARASRGTPAPAKRGGFAIGVNNRFATPMNNIDNRSLTPMAREAETFATQEDAARALSAWGDAPDGAQVVELA